MMEGESRFCDGGACFLWKRERDCGKIGKKMVRDLAKSGR